MNFYISSDIPRHIKFDLPRCAYKDFAGFNILFKGYTNILKYESYNLKSYKFKSWNKLVEFANHVKENNICVEGLYFCPSDIVYSYFRPTLEYVEANEPTGYTEPVWFMYIHNG